jgi:aminoglycoside phosphotransferase (APT) family kinase protein
MTDRPRRKALPADLTDIRARTEGSLRPCWPEARVGELDAFTGGTSSLTYRCDLTGAPVTSVVVKVAPPGLDPVRNRDVLRQARVLEALAAVDGVSVPRVHGSHLGDPPGVPPLFVMELLAGDSFEPRHHPDSPDHPPADVRTRALAAARMLADLHKVAPADIGLGGEPVIALVDEVGRWHDALATCPLPETTADLAARVHKLLGDTVPAALPAVVQHGDWRLGNMQCAGAAINGVIDWEIWSIGDPRMDLAWLLMMIDADHPLATNPRTPLPGLDELRAEYERARGAGVPDAGWFDALVRYKQAAASALLVKNADKRGDADERVEAMRSGVRALLAAAEAILAR